MRASRSIAAGVGFWAALAASGAGAQDLVPAEIPPSSFEGTQYVDSSGCAFIRAGISGTVSWVPRLTRDRDPVCGLPPTFPVAGPMAAAEPPAEEPAPPAPAPAPERLAEAEPPAPAPAPVPPRPATGPGAPIQTVAMTAAAPPPPRPAAVPQVVVAAPAVPSIEPVRITIADLCADAARTGTRYVDRATGQPIACEATAVALLASGRPAAPSAAPAPAAPARVATPVVAAAPALVVADCAYVVAGGVAQPSPDGRCGPDPAPVAATRALTAPGTWDLPFLQPSIPASNPVGLVPQVVAPPPGYEPVWEDGRINPHRGLPRVISGPVLVGATVVLPAR